MQYLKLLRPKQWSKNLLVFAALLFATKIQDPRSVMLAVMAFFAMCLVSSAVYVANDLRDIEKDRAHPKKRLRPLASGKVKPAAGIVVGLLCVVFAAALLWGMGFVPPADMTPVKNSFAVVIVYVILQIIYNSGAKAIAVLDVFFIAMGFVLRAVLGAAAIQKPISAWLLLCTGALALLLGFSKRRHEYIWQGDKRTESRKSLAGYSKESLDVLVAMSATAAALTYGIYALQSQTAQMHHALFLTTIFVVYGVCRYVLIVFVDNEGGEPETLLLKDKHVLGSVVLFIVVALIAMSGIHVPLVEFTGGGG